MIAENSPAPDFTLPNADGQPVSLSSFRGRSVVLFFYPASHKKFQAKYGLPYTLLSDPERKVLTAWGAYGEKVQTSDAANQVLPYL